MPSWLKSEINPQGFPDFLSTQPLRPFNQQIFHPKKKLRQAGLAWSAWSPLTGPSWLTWLRFPWSNRSPGELDFRISAIAVVPLRTRVFQSAKSLGLLFSSSAARAPSPSSISWKNRMQNNDLGLVLIRRSRIFFTQAMIQLLFLYLSYSFYASASAFQSPQCVFHPSPWLSHGGQARASWRVS